MIYEFLYSIAFVAFVIALTRCLLEIKELQQRNMRLRIELIHSKAQTYLLQITEAAKKAEKEKSETPQH